MRQSSQRNVISLNYVDNMFALGVINYKKLLAPYEAVFERITDPEEATYKLNKNLFVGLELWMKSFLVAMQK